MFAGKIVTGLVAAGLTGSLFVASPVLAQSAAQSALAEEKKDDPIICMARPLSDVAQVELSKRGQPLQIMGTIYVCDPLTWVT